MTRSNTSSFTRLGSAPNGADGLPQIEKCLGSLSTIRKPGGSMRQLGTRQRKRAEPAMTNSGTCSRREPHLVYHSTTTGMTREPKKWGLPLERLRSYANLYS